MRYVYDVMGRVDTMKSLVANKTIARTYYANGLLRTDVQPYVTHLYGYDRAGKRTFDRIGGADTTTSDSVWYHYNPRGDLTAIGVRWRARSGYAAIRDSVRFRWDSLGRRDSLVYTNGARVSYAYDADGMLRLVCAYHRGGTTIYSHPDHLDLTMLNEWVDADGMIRQQTWNPGVTGCGQNSDEPANQTNAYGVRHQLLYQAQGSGWNKYRYDASGNIVKSDDNNYSRSDTMRTAHSNQLWKRVTSGSSLYMRYTYYPDGGRASEVYCSLSGSCASTYTGSRGYIYDALGRMRGTNDFTCMVTDPVSGCSFGAYWPSTLCAYGPDGRLIDSCDNLTGTSLGYDGDNVVRTAPDGTAAAWTFVHGPGLDDPLLGYYVYASKRIYFLGDGNGRQFAVTDADGEDQSASNEYYYHGGSAAGGTTNSSTYGASRQPSAGIPGLSFFRNRVYDQVTGRWTQEDPIGVAGGVNVYQFNGNNPASYSDPFGLCPPKDNTTACNFQDLIDQVAGRTRGLEKAVTVGLAVELAPLALAGGAELLSAGGLVARTAAPAIAAGTTELAGKTPFEGFATWGRTAVGWGRGAAGAVRAMADMTAEKAATLDPAKVQAAKAFYEAAVAVGTGGAAAPARVELMQRILDIQK